MKKLFNICAALIIVQAFAYAQDFESMENLPSPAQQTHAPVVSQQNALADDGHKSSKCAPINFKPVKKGLEYTGRGIGGAIVGTGGFVGGFVVGLGYFAYRVFPIKCGCEGIYGVDIRIEPLAPFYFAGKGAYHGFKTCW